jgi:uncharacterized protein YkwD
MQSNKVRASHHKRTLHEDPVLNKAAQDYADILKKYRFFDHIHPWNWFKKTPLKRVIAAGGEKKSTAENLAKISILNVPVEKKTFYILDHTQLLYAKTPNGPPIPLHSIYSGAQAVVQSWLDSPGHRENLLHSKLDRIGCGTSILTLSEKIPMIIAVQLFQAD